MTNAEAKNVGILLKASIASRINAAFHANSVPTIAEIEIINDTEEAITDASVLVSSTPGFLKPKIFRLDRMRERSTERLNPVSVELDPAFLFGVTEAIRGEISIALQVGDQIVSSIAASCELLSPSEWTGLATAPELVAAFVRPNDPTTEAVLRNAAEKLRAAGRDPALDGYKARKRARAWEVAEAIWAALSDERIVFALPPQSFEQNGQKVRSPSAILERRLGTCLDLALLFAGCLEQAGLNPVIGFCDGHAFAGLWLIDDAFPVGIIDEGQTVRKRLQAEELVLVETTLLTSDRPIRFRAAVEKAAGLVAADAEKRFELLVDIRRARHRQIKPLTLGPEAASPAISVSAGTVEPAGLEPPPSFEEEEVVSDRADEVVDRLERWKRKLLDLSLRNRLLNFKATNGTVPLVCPDPARLEDLLAQGKRIKLLHAPDVMSGADPRDPNLHFRTAGDDAALRYAMEGLDRNEVHSTVGADVLEARLIEIHRTARTSFEEGGSNSLYLAIGFISWTPQGKNQACKAPLLLVPVALERRTVRSNFYLLRHEDDPQVNPTLLEMLRQDFKLTLPELERELPVDESGLDVRKVWRIARAYLKDMRGFELTEEVVLANFSFAKYLMWKDLVDRTDVLKRNPVVRHLIDTPKDSYGDGAELPDERRLDEEVHPRDLFLPLPSDSSQTAAVIAAARNKDFVLFGPPGTGKSQTIANMITQLLAHGKTVLFVSAKTTALEVVRRRLNEIGLGSFCLEIHSAKAQKTAVLNQLKAAWETRAESASVEWEGATTDLKAVRDRLNAVVYALHRRHRNGLTAHQSMGRVIAGRMFLPGFALPFSSADRHDHSDMAALREACRRLKTALDAIGDPSRHPLDGIRRATWSRAWQNQLVDTSKNFRGAAATLETKLAGLAAWFRVSPISDPRRGRRLLTLAAQGVMDEAESGAVLLGANAATLRDAFEQWKPLQQRYAEIRGELSCGYRDGVFELDLPGLLNEWRQASNAIIFVRNGRKKRVRQALAPFTTDELPDDIGPEIARLLDLEPLRRSATRHDATLAALGRAWKGFDTNAGEVEVLFDWAAKTTRTADRLAGPEAPQRYWIDALLTIISQCAADHAVRDRFRVAVFELAQAFERFDTSRRELAQLAETPDEWLGFAVNDAWLAEAVTTARAWEGAAAQTQRWCGWREAASSAEQFGLAPLVEDLTAGAITTDQILYAFELGYARSWIERVVDSEEALRTFIADHHEDTIAQFVKIDARVAELARHVVAGRLSGNVPPRTRFGRDPEFGVLAREIEKRARHLPLRRLFGQMPTALTRLAPCLMMSPLSVAQYLPADAQPLDVVIFDEASQIPVWDAIGAIARGKQVIVVGDPKQLPPTTFFDRSSDGYDDASDLEDLESILDECLGANIPHKRLVWHYRSRHESLIAFSNERYYEGRLVTFPSPVTDDRAVRYVHVPGGIYERGSGRVNREEARAVVREVVSRLLNPAFVTESSSLGVVTFNTEQQHLIETMLDQERRSRTELERFFGPEWHEPVFVKNLETVQGDERDVILFSVGYGPDAAGRVSQNFGPLNKDGGARRLNVAITRARSELLVFATLKPDHIDLSRTKAAGVADFKHFLEYAERGPGALARAAAPLDRDPDSPFEEAVRKALEEAGWIVHPQVGVAGFRVDLGIVHPDAPGRYLAGVECDGASYHRSATARDRDLLREHVLRGLGWRIHRVWSTDWWVDTETAIANLMTALETDLRKDREEVEAAAANTRHGPEFETVDSEVHIIEPQHDTDDELSGTPSREIEVAALTVRYGNPLGMVPAEPKPDQSSFEIAAAPAAARVEAEPRRAEPHIGIIESRTRAPDYVAFNGAPAPDPRTAATGIVADSLCRIIEVEGPMLAKRAYDIYLRGRGIRRLGGELRTALNRALAKAIKDGRVLSENEPGVTGLIYSTVRMQDTTPVKLRARGPRSFEEIPPGELRVAATHVFQADRMIWGSDEHLRAILEFFDLKRLTTQVGTRLLEILEQLDDTSPVLPSVAARIDSSADTEHD
jgi:very-short-patch-repair endonuclease